MASNDLTVLELPLSRRPSQADVPVLVIRAQKTAAAAFALSCQASGLDDKEIYLSIDLDAGHFSRIKRGEAHFPGDKLQAFCRVVGNTIYVEWLAYQVGCSLVMIETEAERRAREATEKLRVAEDRVRFLTDVIAGRAA